MKGAALWMIEPSGQMFQYYGCASGRGKQLVRNEIEKGKFQELTVQEALPRVAKILLKAQDEIREKKMELELSVICADSKWTNRILDRPTTDRMTKEAQEAIENEDEEMAWVRFCVCSIEIFSECLYNSNLTKLNFFESFLSSASEMLKDTLGS